MPSRIPEIVAMPQLTTVILDWAGTMVDHGSLAPLSVFKRAFAEIGLEISDEEAKGPMGLPKWHHIRAVGQLPRVAAAWQQRFGGAFCDDDVDRLHDLFKPMTLTAVARHAELIPGAAALVAELRQRNLRIGSSTGYDRVTMEVLAPLAAAQGYAPDCMVTATDLPIGRPSPMMMWCCFQALQVGAAALAVKVDDTVPGIVEGRAAGSWVVGVTDTGNEMGLSALDLDALPAAERARRAAAIGDRLIAAGADYGIASVAALPAILDQINARLAAGERPRSI
jgi:phosphonoacetaldehyde hydrolase